VQRDQGEVATQAFLAIEAQGPEAWPAFRRFPEFLSVGLHFIKDPDPERQRAGLHLICGLGYRTPKALLHAFTPDRRAGLLPYMVRGLEQPDGYLRIRYIEALGYLRERSAVPRLIESLGDPDATVRHFAVSALGRIGDERAIPTLGQVAAKDPARDYKGRFYLREAAQKAIEQIRAAGRARR